MSVSEVSDNIEKLYKIFGILADAKENIGEHEKEYLEILAAVKGSAKEKRLASQFIARFFKDFPGLADQALEAQLDLCEDEDVSIRKQAIKDLPLICRDSREQVPKIADILAQLLQAEDNSEFLTVQESLLSLFKLDDKGSLSGIYSQLLNGEESVRERCIKFVTKKLLPLDRSVISKPAEDLLIAETKRVLQDVTGNEFIQLMHVLGATRLSETATGQRELTDIIAEQAELDHPFDPRDESQIDRIIHCTHCAIPYFSAHVTSNRFVIFLIEQVLSQIDEIPKEMKNFKHVHLELFKVLAESITHCTKLPNDTVLFNKLLNALCPYMPLPPKEPNADTNFQFSHIEALLYSLHRLGKICSDPISGNMEKYKDFKSRLQYLACHAQGYNRGLRDDLRGKAVNLKDEAYKLKLLTLKTTNNINAIVRDLFHNPPRFQAAISLSWKQTLKALTGDVLEKDAKRKSSSISHNDESNPNPSKQFRPEGREIYHPPSGKFSNKVGGYGGGNRPMGNWRNRGRGRDFRSGRWRY